MAKDASKVRVALTGSIIVADENATDPTNFDNLAALGTELGFTTEDGVTFSFSKETEDIMGWQSMEPLRRLVTSSPKTASFTLRQLERATWLATMGGTVTEKAGGLFMWEPDDGTIATHRLYIHFRDGEFNYLFGFRRAQQMGEVEMNLVRNDAVNLPNEWSALAATGDNVQSWFLLTDDPAFAAAAGTTPVATPTAWAATTAYALDATVTVAGGTLKATTAGTSGSTEPTAPAAVGDTVTDGTVVWTRTA